MHYVIQSTYLSRSQPHTMRRPETCLFTHSLLALAISIFASHNFGLSFWAAERGLLGPFQTADNRPLIPFSIC